MRFVLIALLAACNDDLNLPNGGGPAADRIDTILALEGDATPGEAVVDEHCVVCHDKTGATDAVGPALAPYVSANTDEAILTVILDGVGAMPAQNVDDQEAADLLAWLRAEFSSGAIDGAALFDRRCLVCHPSDGGPGVGPGMSGVVPNRTVEQLVATITNGVPPTMTAFEGVLSEEEIAALAAWLKETWP
jgi:mono/diheme cytochrome c family protein